MNESEKSEARNSKQIQNSNALMAKASCSVGSLGRWAGGVVLRPKLLGLLFLPVSLSPCLLVLVIS
jgi:hypothetical protein